MTDLSTLAGPATAELARGVLADLAKPAHGQALLSQDTIEMLYALGFRLLTTEQYEQARAVFLVLFSAMPADPRILSGLGHCLAGLGDPVEASLMHTLALSAEPDHPGHALALAEDLVAMRSEFARDMLLQTIDLAAPRSEHAATANRARALLALLERSSPSA